MLEEYVILLAEIRLKLNIGTNKTYVKRRESLSCTVPTIVTSIWKPFGRWTMISETFL